MIHYHGTPITPDAYLQQLAGDHFCVSFSAPRQLSMCLAIGQSVMGDNGAFSEHTRGKALDVDAYYEWLRGWLRPPHWAVIPDKIGGTEDEQDMLAVQWPFDRHLGGAVWHMNESLQRLAQLARNFPRICFGSAAEYWEIGTVEWQARIDAAWETILGTGRTPWVHMLRGLKAASEGPWPFASADSVYVARNFKGTPSRGQAAQALRPMARAIDATNPPAVYQPRKRQAGLFGGDE